MSSFYAVHVQGRVLRLIAQGPDAEAKCRLAVQCTPRAAYVLCKGELPEDIEGFAYDFKNDFLDAAASAFLAEHEEDEPVTKVEKPSGMHKRISLVEN